MILIGKICDKRTLYILKRGDKDGIRLCTMFDYPVMIIGAGLPKIYKMLSDEKSYSERLFMYKQIGSLSLEQSKKAIEEPAKKFKVEYTEYNGLIN